MPTGYTHDVQTGKVTEFRDFALNCARAFGALILMRDEPADTAIPEEFQPSDYHERGIEAAQKELIALEALGPRDASLRARSEYEAALASWHERKDRRAAEKIRYEAMLAKAASWTPPSGRAR